MDITIREEKKLIIPEQTIITRLAHMGKAFYDSNTPTALRAAQNYAGVEGSVYSLPELANLRVQGRLPFDNWFTANTEEFVGKSKGGSELFGVAHGGAFLTRDPARIEATYKAGLINGAAKIDDAEFQALVDDGKHLDGSDAKLYRLSEITNWGDVPYDGIILADKADFANLASGRQEITQLMDNPLVHMRLLGPERAAKYLYAAGVAYDKKNLGNWHPFASADAGQAQGRVVFLGGNSLNGLNGGSVLSDIGRFVGVAPEAQGDSSRSGAQNLEAELRAFLGRKVAPDLFDDIVSNVLRMHLRYSVQTQE